MGEDSILLALPISATVRTNKDFRGASMSRFDPFQFHRLVPAIGLLIALNCQGRIIYVDGGLITDPVPDGLTWATAFSSVQDGINLAVDGDEVWVAAATYFENLSLKSGVALYGGFAGIESALDERNWTNNVCVLDGRQTNSVVIIEPGATNTTRLDGFTIQNGRAARGGGILCSNASPVIVHNRVQLNASTSTSPGGGGGIFCDRSFATIADNLVISNSASGTGGGLALQQSGVSVSGNVISHNRVTGILVFGGGIYCRNPAGASPVRSVVSRNTIAWNSASSGAGIESDTGDVSVFSENIVAHNSASAFGGGMECYSSSPEIHNNQFIGNMVSGTGAFGGGAISVFNQGGSASPLILNNAILANVLSSNATFKGAGVYCSAESSAQLINNTIAGNLATTGIANDSTTSVILNNLIAFNGSGMRGTTVGVSNNCVYGNTAEDFAGIGDNGNFSADPRLSPQLAEGDIHLLPDSLCRDRGIDTPLLAGRLDIDGQARLQGISVDIGADESDGAVHPFLSRVIRVSPDGDDRRDGSDWPSAKKTVQAGIDAASLGGGAVWVRAGVFGERVALRGLAHLYGGFQGSESRLDQRNWKTNESVLDGGGAGSVVTATNLGNWCGIDGFTIRNGSSRNGAGLFLTNSSPLVANNLITLNTSTNGTGGGIYLNGSFSKVTGNRIVANTAGGSGGGIYVTAGPGSGPEIQNNLLSGNSTPGAANNQGGAIYCRSAASILNNSLLSNTAGKGGGLFLFTGSAVVINNLMAFGSSGLSVQGAVNSAFRNNCVFGNNGLDYQDVADQTGTNGNISLDPLLVSSNDFHLAAGSPCIDAGDNSGVVPAQTDLDGQVRQAGARVDIGADEFGSSLAFSLSLLAGPAPNEHLLRIEGEPDRTYVVERGSGFTDWLPVSTNTAPTGIIEVPVTVSSAPDQSYFRAVAPVQ